MPKAGLDTADMPAFVWISTVFFVDLVNRAQLQSIRHFVADAVGFDVVNVVRTNARFVQTKSKHFFQTLRIRCFIRIAATTVVRSRAFNQGQNFIAVLQCQTQGFDKQYANAFAPHITFRLLAKAVGLVIFAQNGIVQACISCFGKIIGFYQINCANDGLLAFASF